MKSIQDLLGRLVGEKKLLYDQKEIERLYLEYQLHECDDSAAKEMLHSLLAEKQVLIVGPGKSVKSHAEQIASFISSNHPIIIAINSIPEEIEADYIFATNNKRYTKLLAQLVKPEHAHVKLIATSNLCSVSKNFTFVLNYGSLIDENTEIPDNSLIMLLRALMEEGVGAVALAGFDGYLHTESNYLNAEMEYSFVHEKVDYLNGYIADFLKKHSHELNLTFVTPSQYEE